MWLSHVTTLLYIFREPDKILAPSKATTQSYKAANVFDSATFEFSDPKLLLALTLIPRQILCYPLKKYSNHLCWYT